VVEKMGPERVVIENDYDFVGRNLSPAFLPEVISRVVEETGCGLLLDLAHARLASNYFGLGARDYIDELPTAQIREIHVSGVQPLEGWWAERLSQVGGDLGHVRNLFGRLVDHLPMTEADWSLCEWAMRRIHDGAWGQPWAVTFEYGGLTGFFRATTDKGILADQIPRLYTLVTGT
jgi:uncharacterized protein (UPF0276 family)